MRLPRFKLNHHLLEAIAQAFDITGSIRTSRVKEILNRTPTQALALDWENVTRDWDRAVGRYTAAHAE